MGFWCTGIEWEAGRRKTEDGRQKTGVMSDVGCRMTDELRRKQEAESKGRKVEIQYNFLVASKIF